MTPSEGCFLDGKRFRRQTCCVWPQPPPGQLRQPLLPSPEGSLNVLSLVSLRSTCLKPIHCLLMRMMEAMMMIRGRQD